MSQAILRYLAPVLFVLVVLVHAAPAQLTVGSASIIAPAVVGNNTGALTQISVTVTKGTGYVTIIGPSFVGNDTKASALNAAISAAQYLKLDYKNYNFTYNIADYNQSVSGPSAGAAMTLLAISAISGNKLVGNFTMTGTISNGSIGLVGGVYDKADAAGAYGLKFILVPAVSQGSEENELYYLIQNKFGIPLIEVLNITAAASYAFGKSPTAGHSVTFNFSTNYYPGLLPNASLVCSNSCNSQPFAKLTNFTINITASQIARVSGFPNASAQLYAVLNQSRAIAAGGYLYTASDISFLNYINAFFLASSNATISSGMQTLTNVSSYCTSLNAPQLTQQNYEWVIAGELRLAWGTYTAATTSSDYNASSFTTDDVLSSLYSAGEANAWCRASGFMFSSAAAIGGTPVIVSQGLTTTAGGRISRASVYGNNIYLQTAETAYSNHNYPLAIMDADYAYAEGTAGIKSQGMTTSELLNASQTIAANSTYGAWATQFANEAEFYIHQSEATNSVTGARGYALQAYSSALLAQQMSNDTQVISNGLVLGQATTTASQVVQPVHNYNLEKIAIYLILVLVVIILIIDFIILAMVSKLSAGKGTSSRRRRSNR
jgi:hypothetical protein